MRFKLDKPARESDYRKTRTIHKFLWLPRMINYEIRWLEGALIEQRVDYNLHLGNYPSESYKKYYWKDIRWVDEPANLK